MNAPAPTPRPLPRPVMLDCCVCGGGSRGRQWNNRDDGYGICDRCAVEQAQVQSPEEMRKCYGVQGIHYLLTSAPIESPTNPERK